MLHCNTNCSVYCISIPDEELFSETAVGCTASYFVKILWCSRWSFEVMYCFMCGRRRVAVTRMICLVHIRRTGKRWSKSVLWQNPQHQRNLKKAKCKHYKPPTNTYKRHQNIRLHSNCEPTKDNQFEYLQPPNRCGKPAYGPNRPTPHNSNAMKKDTLVNTSILSTCTNSQPKRRGNRNHCTNV